MPQQRRMVFISVQNGKTTAIPQTCTVTGTAHGTLFHILGLQSAKLTAANRSLSSWQDDTSS